MDMVNTIMAYEEGTLGPIATVRLFAELIRSGSAWKLQGSYGRAAAGFIKAGLISPDGEVNYSALEDELAEWSS